MVAGGTQHGSLANDPVRLCPATQPSPPIAWADAPFRAKSWLARGLRARGIDSDATSGAPTSSRRRAWQHRSRRRWTIDIRTGDVRNSAVVVWPIFSTSTLVAESHEAAVCNDRPQQIQSLPVNGNNDSRILAKGLQHRSDVQRAESHDHRRDEVEDSNGSADDVCSAIDDLTNSTITDSKPFFAERALTGQITKLRDSGSWRQALDLLREAEERSGMIDEEGNPFPVVNVVIYNAVLAVLSRAGRWVEAVALTEELKEKGIKRDTFTFVSAIIACRRGGQWRRAMDLLDMVKEEGLAVNAYVYSAAISACAKVGKWERALQLLDEMTRVENLPPNIQCYNAAMDACAKAGKVKQTLGLLSKMRDVGLFPTKVSYLAAVMACSNAGDWREALSLFSDLTSNGLVPDEKIYSAVITACGNGSQWQQAVHLLEDSKQRKIMLNEVCYNAAMTACGKGGQWRKAMDLLEEMKVVGAEPSAASYHTVIDACAMNRRWEEAWNILELMRARAKESRFRGDGQDRSPLPNAATYTAVIYACGRAWQWEAAIEIMREMQAERIRPTDAVYHTVLMACAKAGQWREAVYVMEEMRSSGMPFKVLTFNLIITACARGNQWQQAIAVFKEMPSRGAMPDTVSYNAVLLACEQAGYWRRARALLDYMRKGIATQDERRLRTAEYVDAREGTQPETKAEAFPEDRLESLVSRDFDPPRPDDISFRTTLKALANAGAWRDVYEVLGELKSERAYIWQLRHKAGSDQSEVSGVDLSWNVNVERLMEVFTCTSSPVQSRSAQDATMRKGKALDLVAEIAREEINAEELAKENL